MNNREKLLVLGAYKTEIEIIDAAHSMGYYVIVTDNHENYDDAPAKYVADEAWNISWLDIEKLCIACNINNVKGIMAGFSELRVRAAEELALALKLPFYADGADLTTICEKNKFKNACIESGVCVPKRYLYGEKIQYPVIVKPSDNGGSRGITICYSEIELDDAYKKAASVSNNGDVLIEQYIKAEEVMVYFTVHNGMTELSAMCDRHMRLFDEHITQLPIAYVYPSKYLETFEKYNFDAFKRLIYNLGIKDGLIAFQAFVVNRDVIPFDPTYRLDGTMTYHIVEAINGINVLKLLINKSMNGTMGDDAAIASLENPHFNKYAFELAVLLGKGTIGSIEGLDEIEKEKNVIYVNKRLDVGNEMHSIADFSQIFCRIHIVADSVIEIADTVEKINDNLAVLDNSGNDMIICRLTRDEIMHYYI